MDNETSKLIQVAKLYYEENLNQSEIAKRIGVSRPLISNMLAKARKLGIVEIKIKEPFANNTLLLNQLKNIFNINNGFVIPSTNSEYMTKRSIISQSIEFLKEILPESKVFGIGWGYTISNLVNEMKTSQFTQTFEGHVVPLIGSASFPDKGYHPIEITREFGEITGLTSHVFFSPAFPTTEQEKELYTTTENYHEIERYWQQLDTIVLAVGSFPSVPDHATALRFGNALQKEHAAGMILSYFFNKEGHIIEGKDDFAIQVPKEYLGSVKRVIAICPDEVSPKAVLGALRTGFITDVIMTEEKAKTIINLRTQ